MKKLLIILLAFSPQLLYAQKTGQQLIDSLLRAVPAAKDDTNKVRLFNMLAHEYYSIDAVQGIRYASEALKLAKELDWKTGIGISNKEMGLNYYSRSENVSALACLREGLNIFEELDDKINIAECLAITGNVYQYQSNYPDALQYQLKALKMNTATGNKTGIANNLNSIGILYIDQTNFPGALEYFLKALKINRELGNKSGIALNLKNVGNAYICQHNYPMALANYLEALKIAEEIGNKSGIARNLGNIGNVYQEQGNYRVAQEYLLKAARLNEGLGEKYPMANDLGSVGCMYLTIAKDSTYTSKSKDMLPDGVGGNGIDKVACLRLAVDYLEKATTIDKEIGNLNEFQHFSVFLSEAHELLGNYREAFERYKAYSDTKDSVFSRENIQKLTFIQGQRDEELNEKKLEVQRLQLLADKNRQRYYIAGLGLLILLSAGLYSRSRTARRNRKTLEEKNRLIAAEKENADMLRLRAETSEQVRQQFLANMSHEIRTPMNSVNGMTDILIDKNPRPDQLHYLQIIAKSSDILLHIINDILDLSKIETGKLELEAIDFSLTDTVKHVKETLSFRADEKGLRLVAHIDDNITDVLLGDPFRLNQILINLGGNAVKFTEKGSVEINVQQKGEDAGNVTLLFEIRDTGIGIPEDKIATIFENFKQVNSSDTRKFGGTGLGLSISKRLVEMQGGNIKIVSEPGRGTVFSFSLSYPKGSAQRLRQRIQQEQKADGRMLSGLHILLVDDNDDNRMVALEILRSKSDMAIDQAANGEEAIRLVEKNDYDVVVMDIQMPVMNGLDATRYIRTKLPAPKNKIPVIALTASILRSDAAMCTEAGMNLYVAKPFKAWQLIAAIADLTGRKDTAAAQNETLAKNPEIPSQAYAYTDLTYLRNFCEGDEVKMKKYIGVYLKSVPPFIDKVNAAMEANDMQEVASQVHAFKPKWMLMGMKQSTELGQKIEKQAKSGATKDQLQDGVALLLLRAAASLEELDGRK